MMGNTHTTRRGLTVTLLVAAAGVFALTGCRPKDEGGAAVEVEVSERVVGEVGLSPGQFASPRCIENDGKTLWVIDKEARVQRIDPKTGDCLAIFKMPEYAFGKPTGFTIIKEPGKPGSNLMFVADTHYHRVRVYRVPQDVPAGPRPDTEPELVKEFGSFGRDGGQFVFPTDIAILHDMSGEIEKIYVSEYGGNDRISIFDKNYKFVTSFGQFGAIDASENPGLPSGQTAGQAVGPAGGAPASASAEKTTGEKVEFSRPQSIGIDEKRRELVVTDACNHRVGIFTLDGKLIRWLSGTHGADDLPGTFAYPYGLSLLGDGTAVVSEFGNGRAQHVDLQTGACLGLYGGPKEDDGKAQRLGNAWGVTILDTSMYVLDMRRSRIVCHKAPAVRH